MRGLVERMANELEEVMSQDKTSGSSYECECSDDKCQGYLHVGECGMPARSIEMRSCLDGCLSTKYRCDPCANYLIESGLYVDAG